MAMASAKFGDGLSPAFVEIEKAGAVPILARLMWFPH